MKTKKQYKTSLPHCLLFFLSPNIPSLSTNPRGGEPGPLNQDEPHDSGFYSCAMPRGARAPESGDRRGVDAKPSPCRCVGIIAEKNSTSYGERRPSRPGLFWALFALVSLLLLVCRECIIETDAPSASLLNRVGSGLPLSLASLSMSSFRLSTTRKTIFDPDLQLVSFFPTKKKKMKNTKTRQLLARASSSSSASPAGDDSLPSSSSSPESMNINAAAADDLTISLFKRKRRRRADWSLGPALDLSPDDALRMQMDALRDNDAPYRDHGVEVLYRFADIDPFARSSYSGRSQDLGQFEVRSMFWGARNGASCGDGGGETARRRRAPRVIASFAIGDSSLIPDRISRGKRPSSKKKNSPSFNTTPAPPPPLSLFFHQKPHQRFRRLFHAPGYAPLLGHGGFEIVGSLDWEEPGRALRRVRVVPGPLVSAPAASAAAAAAAAAAEGGEDSDDPSPSSSAVVVQPAHFDWLLVQRVGGRADGVWFTASLTRSEFDRGGRGEEEGE